MPSSHLILCHSLLLLSPIPPSIRVFSNESAPCMRWPKYWSFSFSISPSNEHPGLVSFRMDWLDLPAVQGTLKSLLQHHSSKASILWRSAFFTVQLSHPYVTSGKTIALSRRTFVGKVIPLLFNMLSRLVITFLRLYKKNVKKANPQRSFPSILIFLWILSFWRPVWRFLKKTGNRTAILPSNSTAGHTHWGNQNWKRHVYPNVHRSTVYNSQDMEAT